MTITIALIIAGLTGFFAGIAATIIAYRKGWIERE